ncbi:MAG: acyl-CoA dehydrogenase family protein [Acidimicrobiia bacterium]
MTIPGASTAIDDDGAQAKVLALVYDVVRRYPPSSTSARDFLRARYDAGLAWVWFPEGFGGLGLAPSLQTIADRAMAAAGGYNTTVGSVGYMMTASAIITYGTDAVKHEFLPMIYTHAADWVQLFSEPGSGSDLAGLLTRAMRDGDEWIVNGQKVWSSGGMKADWGLLLARTDPDVPKHNGITAFLIDMHQPGVEPRPLRNMVGSGEFSEVFFTDARIPDAYRLGPVNGGWGVGLTILMNERVNFTADFAGAGAPRPDGPIQQLLAMVKANGIEGPYRDHFMRVWVAYEVSRLTNLRSAAARTGGTPGPEGSIGKIASTELTKRVANLAMELLGAHAMILPTRYPVFGEPDPSRDTDDLRFNFLGSPSNTIMGGTSEIQRNNVAERVLGLPGEPRGDKGVPWKEIPRNG